MLYAKVVSGAVTEYPVTEFAIRQAMPNVSFPEVFRPIDPYVEVTGEPPQAGWDQKVVEGTPNLVNGKWVRDFSLVAYTAAEKDALVAEAKGQKFAELAAIRWTKETGGTLFNGVPVSTDAVSQTKYIGAVVGAQIDPSAMLKWKMIDGSFVVLDAQQITNLAMAVRAHVQACFDHEADLREAILACATLEALRQVDLAQGWPG